MDKAEDKAYLAELKKRCDDNGVKSGLDHVRPRRRAG